MGVFWNVAGVLTYIISLEMLLVTITNFYLYGAPKTVSKKAITVLTCLLIIVVFFMKKGV